MIRVRRLRALALGAVYGTFVAAGACAAPGAAAGATLRDRILAAYAPVKSYRLTVLGSVRSMGVYVSPNRYEMTTTLDGKPVKTVIIGSTYWIYDNGSWQKSGSTGTSLDADVAGLLRKARQDPATPFVALSNEPVNGRVYGTFRYRTADGDETCNFDPKTYLIVRCRKDDLTILYSGFNDKRNAVPNLH